MINNLTRKLGIQIPIFQAPMAGVSTPEMAATVSNSGGLGSIGVGNLDSEAARKMVQAVRTLSDQPFNVNVFCHPPAIPDPEREAAWLLRLETHFARYGAKPSKLLREIYTSFLVDNAMLDMLVNERPTVVSFHFGLPDADRIRRLKEAGITLLATATNPAEALAVEVAGVDVVIAQGYEAGGHRGTFDQDAPDECLGTMALTRLLVRTLSVPVVAAGGIMDGAGVAASLALGASAAQLGTAFILCPESAADSGYRRAMVEQPARRTVMTSAISGRPARSLANLFTEFGDLSPADDVPSYPIAYDAGKALHAAAKAVGEFGYGAQWAGQGVALARSMPAGELVGALWRECQEALALEIRRPSAP
ncbi:nitronate monooxygenase [Singulisphaera sp. Ch08]|uniref:Nitronate monooxygenase n=1 Tax=Singulisphaera sp. Ch08 TaxID=3120278 RepID=A0AAU7C8W7_9BACT